MGNLIDLDLLVINEFSKYNNVSEDVPIKFLNTRPDDGKKRTINDLYCKCGKFKKMRGKYVHSYCGNSKCWMHYGKKRPKHSETMKKCKSKKYLDNLIRRGDLLNKDVNSDEFKLKLVRKAGLDTGNLGKDYSNYMSLLNTRNKVKRYTTIFNKLPLDFKELIYDKYKLNNIDINTLYELDYKEKQKLYYDIHSLNTQLNNQNILKARNSRYKKYNIEGIVHHNRGLTYMICRSKYERDWINYFEKNKIKWDYEPIIINCDKGTYCPDFLIELDDIKYLIEVKGTMYGYPDNYLTNKISSAIEYSKDNNYKFVFILNEKVNKENIINNIITNINDINIEGNK